MSFAYKLNREKTQIQKIKRKKEINKIKTEHDSGNVVTAAPAAISLRTHTTCTVQHTATSKASADVTLMCKYLHPLEELT